MAPALALALCLGQIPDSPRQRTELESNGIRIFVEQIDASPRLSMQLTALLGGLEEDAATEMTLAHLVEHTAARGTGDLDSRLEGQGMYLTAETSREAVTFRIDCQPDQFVAALNAITEILMPRQIKPEELAREKRILNEEEAVVAWSHRQSSLAWQQILKMPGHSGFFDSKTLEAATPESLAAFQEKLFAGQRLSITAVGGISAKSTLDRIKLAFESRPRGPFSVVPGRTSTMDLRVWGRSGLDGGVLSVGVESVDDLDTLAVIGAGMALGMRIPGSNLIMSPAARASVVTLANPDADAIRGVPELVKYEGAALAEIGLRSVRRWVDGIKRDPSQFAAIQGPCAARNLNLTMDRISASADRLNANALYQAMELYVEGVQP